MNTTANSGGKTFCPDVFEDPYWQRREWFLKGKYESTEHYVIFGLLRSRHRRINCARKFKANWNTVYLHIVPFPNVLEVKTFSQRVVCFNLNLLEFSLWKEKTLIFFVLDCIHFYFIATFLLNCFWETFVYSKIVKNFSMNYSIHLIR